MKSNRRILSNNIRKLNCRKLKPVPADPGKWLSKENMELIDTITLAKQLHDAGAPNSVEVKIELPSEQFDESVIFAAKFDALKMPYSAGIKLKPPNINLQQLAYHEAGHAAAEALLFGLRDCEGIELDDCGSGAVVSKLYGSVSGESLTPAIYMAGAWAAARYANMPLDFLDQCEEDWNIYSIDESFIIESKPVNMTKVAWIAQVEGETNKLLSAPDVWPCIITCAERLLAAVPQNECRWLDVSELKTIFAPIILKGVENRTTSSQERLQEPGPTVMGLPGQSKGLQEPNHLEADNKSKVH